MVLINRPFTDSSGSKVRPALIVSSDRDNDRLPNVIVATITKNTSRVGKPIQLLIDLSTPDGTSSGLNATSAMVGNDLFTVDRSKIIKRLGNLSPARMARIDLCLKAALGLP